MNHATLQIEMVFYRQHEKIKLKKQKALLTVCWFRHFSGNY